MTNAPAIDLFAILDAAAAADANAAESFTVRFDAMAGGWVSFCADGGRTGAAPRRTARAAVAALHTSQDDLGYARDSYTVTVAR